MKNKTLAILGIGAYILSVLSSVESNGNYIAPTILIAISGIATIVFIIMAATRLWKSGVKVGSIIFVSAVVFNWVLTAIQVITSSSYGSLTIILLNISKIIWFLVFIWAISVLWVMTKKEK